MVWALLAWEWDLDSRSSNTSTTCRLVAPLAAEGARAFPLDFDLCDCVCELDAPPSEVPG